MFSTLFSICVFGLTALFSPLHPSAQTVPPSLRVGKHSFTLQWVGWEKPGTATITKKGGLYLIKGEHKNKAGDYAKIDGTLKMVDARNLTFEGLIETKVSYVNNGEVCLRDGTYHFKATGTRKYWRLQEMDNCEGNNVVDYVDIFF